MISNLSLDLFLETVAEASRPRPKMYPGHVSHYNEECSDRGGIQQNKVNCR